MDEAISYLAARLTLSDIFSNTVQSSHPPLYYAFLHFWQQWLPDTDPALRTLGLLLNLFLIPAIYLLTKVLFTDKAATVSAVPIWSAFLVTISPFHLLYSHELRMYTLLMLLVTVGAYAYWQARQSEGWFWWLAFGGVFVAATYTHLFAFLPLAGIGLHALATHQDRRALWRTSLVIFVILLCFTPWLATMVAESQKDLGSLRPFRQEIRNPLKPLITPAFLIFGIASQPIYIGIVLFLTLAITAVFLLEIRKIRLEGTSSGLVLLLLITGCVLVVPILVYMIRPFFLPERTMAAASPFLLVLLAWATTRRQSPLPYLVYGTAAAMLIGVFLYHTGEPLKPPYREAIQFVAAQRQENDIILHTSDGSYLPSLRYVTLPNHVLLSGDPDPRKPVPVYVAMGGGVWGLEDVAGRNGRLWLIIALEHSVEWQTEQTEHFADQFTELESYNFDGLKVILYELN
jgi:uncharacterized membrane protein